MGRQKKGSHPATDAEFSLLQFLWEHGRATKREITMALYPAGRTADYATVQKLLERLESKGYIKRDRSSFAHVIEPALTQNEFAGAQLKAVADKLSGGSLVPLLAHLVEDKKLSARERREIRKLFDETQ